MSVLCLVSVRKWKSKSGLKNVATWDYEVGEAPRQPVPHELGFMESTANVRFYHLLFAYIASYQLTYLVSHVSSSIVIFALRIYKLLHFVI